MHTFGKKIPLYLLVLLPALMAAPLSANVKTVTGQLSLMATLDGKPAFREVLWRLTSAAGNSHAITKILKRHTATLDLEPGTYKISVSLGNKTRHRELTIKESKKHSLVISLD